MRVTITGASGMLGTDLCAAFSASGAHQVDALDLPGCDITEPSSVLDHFLRTRPELVIHAAAWTDVDACEEDPSRAFRVNAEGTRNVVNAASAVGARVFYLSTDYVFDGAKRQPYIEDDPPNPLSAYGRSKLAGEGYVLGHPRGLVVRTAWLFGERGRNFVGSILARAQSGEALRVVDDQVGCPTWSRDLAALLVCLAALPAAGIVHAAGSSACTWFEFAQAITAQAAARGLMAPVPVQAMSSADLRRPAPRPPYSVLGYVALQKLGIGPLPGWRDALSRFLDRVVSQ